MISSLFWIVPVSALLALLFAWIFYRGMKAQEEGTDRMKEIAAYVREGAMAYLKRQYTVVTKVFLILVVLLFILAYFGIQNPFVPVAFLTGGFFSGLCGYLGMKTATFASNRTAWAASKSLKQRFTGSFKKWCGYGTCRCWIRASWTLHSGSLYLMVLYSLLKIWKPDSGS